MNPGKRLQMMCVGSALTLGAGCAWADLPDGLIAYWTFDEGSGNTVYDLAGSNDGTVNGESWTTGMYGYGLRFDGADDAVSMPPAEVFDFGTGDVSISAWFKTSDSEERHAPFIINLGQIDNSPHIEIYVLPAKGGVGTHVLPGNARLEYYGRVSDGHWHHVVITLDNGATGGYRLYLDGIKRGQRTASTLLSDWDAITLRTGRSRNRRHGIMREASDKQTGFLIVSSR